MCVWLEYVFCIMQQKMHGYAMLTMIYIYNTWKECKGIVKDNSYVKLKFSFRKFIVLGIVIFSCYKQQ